jgi:hypothetical protein
MTSLNAISTTASRLAGDWSAPDFARSLTPALLTELTARFDGLDPLVRVRLLLSVLHLPPDARIGLTAELEVCEQDGESWRERERA